MVNRQSEWIELQKKVQEKGLYGANQTNTNHTLDFLADLELGINVNRERGGRSPGRLITVVRRMSTICYMIEKEYGKNKDITTLTEREVLNLFNKVRTGEMPGKRGRIKDVRSFAETMSQFWKWWVKKNKRDKIIIPDITESLDTKNDYKPPWVLLTEKELHTIAEHCKPDYKALLWFMIDSGVRPQEMSQIRVNDISKDSEGVTWCDIRHEIAKKGSFGRKIKLIVCDQLLWRYIKREQLSPEQRLFTISKEAAKKYLQRRAIKLFGDKKSPARDHYKNISLYDLRHNAAIYWRQRYKNFNSYTYRMGWKDPSRAYYYDEFLGHKDTLQEEDLLVDTTVPKLEKELVEERKKRELLEEQLSELNKRMELIELWGSFRTQTGRLTADEENRDKLSKSNRIEARPEEQSDSFG